MNKHLPDCVLNLRLKSGFTQQQLAERFNVPRNTIAKIETGLQDCKTDLLVKYAVFFNVSTDYLLGLDKLRERRAKK